VSDSPWASSATEAAKETKFGTEVAKGMRIMLLGFYGLWYKGGDPLCTTA